MDRAMKLLIGGALVLCPCAVHAATVGFTEDFNSGPGGFGGGSQSYALLSGGVGGTGDTYLQVANTTFTGNLGARSAAAALTGDLIADGVTGFSFWLSDGGADDDLEIYVGVGTAFSNFGITTTGFTPPEGTWAEFEVDLTNPAGWTRIIGAGTFAQALSASDRLLFRHDGAPLDQFPQPMRADFGIDRITVLPEPASLGLLGVAAILAGCRTRLFIRTAHKADRRVA